MTKEEIQILLERAERLWPLYGDTAYEDDNVMKLEHLGTRPCSDQNGIIPAVF